MEETERKKTTVPGGRETGRERGRLFQVEETKTKKKTVPGGRKTGRERGRLFEAERKQTEKEEDCSRSVSYTHLTLPTRRTV